MTTVLLHPQTYRSPTLPSTSTPTPTPLPHRSRPTQQLTVHSTHPSTTSHHHPTKPVPSKTGLPLLSPSPPLPHLPPLSGTTTPIHLITGEQYVERVRQHQRVRLPLDPDSDSGVFPWLHHGSEVRDSLMSGYFGFGRGKAAEVPLYRGLTTIQALSPYLPSSPKPQLHSTFSVSSIGSLTSTSTSTESESDRGREDSPGTSEEEDGEGEGRGQEEERMHSHLVSSFHPSVIFSTSSSHHHHQKTTRTTTFNLPSLPVSHAVNLRSFPHQAAKYASISDLVVYCEDGFDYSAAGGGEGWDGVGQRTRDVLRMAVESVEAERRRRSMGPTKGAWCEMRVYLISDPFKKLEEDYPHLIAIDSRGFARNRLDFFARERDEMRVLTQSSEIGDGVYLGNTQDVPISNPSCSDDNPAGYSICIEAHDQARMPDTQLLRDIDDTLTGFEEDETDDGGLREFGQCSLTEEEDDGDDDEGIPPPVPRKDTAADDSDYLHLPASQIAHLEVLSTPQLLPTTSLPAYLTSLVNLAYFIHLQSSPSPSSSFRPRRVLIHCGDGYTETSTLALTYIMLSRRVPLAEAYLVLQEECGRSFFVYQNDVEVLLDKVERRVQAFLRREDERKGKSGGSEMERSDSGFSEGGGDKRERGSGGGDTREQGKMQLTTPERFPWFFGETWEGCFPSRILSFLYLGNLAHASNALMLKELGITHVVSMGESAMSPPRQPPFSLSSINSSNSRWNLPTNSLWLEECLGNIAVLDIVDIADDGIAGIRRTFDECLDFIEDARVTGGKVLVHCRVGVSRSATVVIAYLMRELELDLKSAYLLTRSRRLNILIQPNLPFAATLHAYEAELILAREAELQARKEGRSDRTDEFLCTEDRVEELGQAGLKWSNRLDWGFLAGEVARLNERFLA